MKNDGNVKIKTEQEMEDIEDMVFKKVVEVTPQLKAVIKSMADIYKEFRSNGLTKDESLAMVRLMLTYANGR